MKKVILVTIAVIVVTMFASVAALANPYTIGAENGRIMPPAGLGLDLNSVIGQAHQSPLALDAQLSYGVSSSVTLAGEVQDLTGSNPDMMAKLYYSPTHDGTGYTAYLGYDLAKNNLPVYGLSMWSDFKYLFAFVDLESNQNQDKGSMMITPGATLKLGSKLRVGGEMSLKMENWTEQHLRIGGSYALSKKMSVKVNLDNGFGKNRGQVWSTGVAVEL